MNTMFEILKEVKFIVLIFLLILLNIGIVLSAPPVLYPNFPLVIGRYPNFMLPYFSNTLAEIAGLIFLSGLLHSRLLRRSRLIWIMMEIKKLFSRRFGGRIYMFINLMELFSPAGPRQ